MKPTGKKRLIVFKMENAFTLLYWRDKGWYVGKLREVPGIFSQGRTLQDLKRNIEEAYRLIVEEGDESIPRPARSKLREIQVFL